jgi:predicted secreted protein
MTKQTISFLFLFTVGVLLFGGDAAGFVDMGFSADGRTYFFGQYGKSDKKFLPYAEIYAVDVQKNDFVRVFKSQGTAQTQSGYEVFEELKAKNGAFLNTYSCSASKGQQILYLRADDPRPASEVLEFEDFEHSTRSDPTQYAIRLVPFVEGKGKNALSSFYIVIERKNQAGVTIDRTLAGNPDIKRAGVSGYRIEKIFTDPTGKNLVIVVEKTIEDGDGTISLRYMVETVVLK